MSKFLMPIFSAILLIRDNKICLLKRSKNARLLPGFYALPGGGIDGNERIPDAAAREALEELRITVQPKDLQCVHTTHVKTPDNQEYINFYFLTKTFSGEPQNTEPEKCDGVFWFDMNELPTDLLPNHKKVLDLIKENKTFSDFGW
ncbi:NUDIX domain-containing protein [Candidatus Dependentiae bacterium]|nr:NUDIX domain-containing protein [Candidatus Dependentiae bacterium]